MALKKTNSNEPDVQVDESVTVDTPDSTSGVDTPVVDTPPVGVSDTNVSDNTTPPVEVDIPETKTSDVEVNTSNVGTPSVDVPTQKQNAGVKVRMRVDHRCTIAMVRYDLKADKTYVVPANVKRILNDAGLLAPL